MHGYDLLITLKNGDVINARAKTTETRTTKIEYFIAESDETIYEIAMTELISLQVTSDHALFSVINLT